MLKSKEQKMKEKAIAASKEALHENVDYVIDSLSDSPQALSLGLKYIRRNLLLAQACAAFEAKQGPLTPSDQVSPMRRHIEKLFDLPATENEQYLKTELIAIADAIDAAHKKVQDFATTDTENVRTDVFQGVLEAFSHLVAAIPRLYDHDKPVKSDGPRSTH